MHSTIIIIIVGQSQGPKMSKRAQNRNMFPEMAMILMIFPRAVRFSGLPRQRTSFSCARRCEGAKSGRPISAESNILCRIRTSIACHRFCHEQTLQGRVNKTRPTPWQQKDRGPSREPALPTHSFPSQRITN